MPKDYSKSLERELLAVQRTLGWMDLVIGSITDAVYVVDRDDRLVFVNQYFSDLLGVPRVFLLGKNLSEVFDLKLKDDLDKEFLASDKVDSDSGEGTSNIFTWYTRDINKIFKVSCRFIDTIQQTVYIAKDITREYEISVMKSNFINIASHQLRTPMTAIMLYANMLKDGYAGTIDSGQYKLVKTIVQSSERMISLINDILLISRVQNGEEDLTIKDSTLIETLNFITDEIEPEIRSKQLNLNVDYAEGIHAVKCNDFIIHEILNNLITNAIQYTPAGGTISVKVEVLEGSVKIAVKDTGIGIPKDYIPQIYQQFLRAPNAFSVFNEGTGLGLYVVKMCVDQINGTIECESEINRGTTFTIVFPS